MNKEKLPMSNTKPSSNNGPVINEPEFTNDLIKGLDEASEEFDEPIDDDNSWQRLESIA